MCPIIYPVQKLNDGAGDLDMRECSMYSLTLPERAVLFLLPIVQIWHLEHQDKKFE